MMMMMMMMIMVVVDGHLMFTTTLTRHGTRSPNPVVTDVCPGLYETTTQIINAFGAAPGHLTQRGIGSMRKVGKMIRTNYIEGANPFMPPTYTNAGNLWSFRAIQKHRHLTSAASIGQGIFPGQPIAIFSEPQVVDNLLATPPGACASETRESALKWLRNRGEAFFREPDRMNLVHKLNRLCANSNNPEPLEKPYEVSTVIENRIQEKRAEKTLNLQGHNNEKGLIPLQSIPGNPHPVVQDICDLLNFMHDQELPRSKNMGTLRKQCTAVSLSMMNARLYSDDDTIARFCGLFPSSIYASMLQSLNHLDHVILHRKNEKDPDYNQEPRFLIYVASRELLYALSHYFGITFERVKGKPEGYIMPGTTLVWELHIHDHGMRDNIRNVLESKDGIDAKTFETVRSLLRPENAFVRTYYFYPSMHDASDRVQVALKACASKTMDCPLLKFGDIVTRWTRRVGPLPKLCPIDDKNEGEKKLSKKEEKNEKKAAKKIEKAKLKTFRQDESVLRDEAREYDRVFCGRNENEGKDWTDDKDLVNAFCTACEDQSERCDYGVDVTRTKSTDEKVSAPRSSRIATTAPRFVPTFLCVVLFSAVAATGLYYSS